MKEIEQRVFIKIERRFGELRDELLAASQKLAKSESHDWTRAERLFTASKEVDELCRTVLTPAIGAHNILRIDENGGPVSAPPDRASRSRSKKDYPKYAVRSGALTKVGLTRDRRTEYEHTVPQAAFDAVTQRLAKLAGRKHFNADDIINKVPCPSYQAYIVISLFRERGLLAVPRRGMYAFRRSKNFLDEARAVWNSLEQNQTDLSHE
jgi:hypothetical protein